MKTLTVVIPHFNSQETLTRLLHSIPTLPWVEVLVIDDHSTIPISKSLTDEFNQVQFLSNTIGNKGPGSARNLGIEQAKGDWILFADSDDYFLENSFLFIEKQLKSHSELILFYPTSVNTDTGEDGKRHLYITKLINEFKETKSRDSLYKFLSTWSVLVSKNLLSKHNIRYGDIMTGEDMIVSTKIKFYANEIQVADVTPIYCVTESNSSLMNRKSEKLSWQRFYATCEVNKFFNQNNLSRVQIPINLEIYELRHYGLKKVLQASYYAFKHGCSLLKGSKFLLRKIVNKN